MTKLDREDVTPANGWAVTARRSLRRFGRRLFLRMTGGAAMAGAVVACGSEVAGFVDDDDGGYGSGGYGSGGYAQGRTLRRRRLG